jgi:hypothetical protein
MNVVALSTRVLEFFTKKQLAKAEERNTKAVRQLKSVKEKVDKSAFELKKKQADTLIQLTKIGKLSEDIGKQAVLQESKSEKVNALLLSIGE